MVYDRAQFASVIDEISGWTLQARRDYITEIGKAFGEESAQQIKEGLLALWKERK